MDASCHKRNWIGIDCNYNKNSIKMKWFDLNCMILFSMEYKNFINTFRSSWLLVILLIILEEMKMILYSHILLIKIEQETRFIVTILLNAQGIFCKHYQKRRYYNIRVQFCIVHFAYSTGGPSVARTTSCWIHPKTSNMTYVTLDIYGACIIWRHTCMQMSNGIMIHIGPPTN